MTMQAGVHMERADLINGFPAPPPPVVRPFHALVSVLKLVINKEDTRQVFEIMNALAGRSGQRMFARFTASDYGRRVVTEPIKLEEILSQRENLRAMPAGSLGRTYLDFMEGEDLTPDGIVSAAEEAGIDYTSKTPFEAYRRMDLHTEVSHDLWHVLTGYGRDALGELCNLGFTRAQTRNPGIRLIIWAGALAAKFERPSMPVWRAIDQGVKTGKNAAWLMGEDISTLLPLPLEEARAFLNIKAPTVYSAIAVDEKEALLKPRLKKTQSQRERKTAPAPV